jgi:ribosome-binding protein aMBF1 (putative translation factor)
MNKRDIQRFRQAIGDIIRKGREDAGLSQEKLAQKLRIPDRTINNYENGRNTMGWIRFVEICKVLNLNAGLELNGVIKKVGGRNRA